MTIQKFLGRTKEEATERAKAELGENVVIMNVREIKPKGLFSVFKKATYEVTAAVEEKESYMDSSTALKNMHKMHETINMAADEPIHIPQTTSKEMEQVKAEQSAIEFLRRNADLLKKEEVGNAERIEEKLENLQSILEKQLSTEKKESPKEPEVIKEDPKKNESLAFVKVLYETLIDNEVNEKYVNQIMDELEKVNWNSSSVDSILSNVYQKMILKFGESHGIEVDGKKPKVVFFVGPTGVGKTTTIAKIASKLKVEQEKKVAFLTADTYRIAAAEQLRTYANILDTSINVIYSSEELNAAVEKLEDHDVIMIDTTGFSHKSVAQKEDTKKLIQSIDERYDSEVYLVLSATTKYKDLIEICDVYKEIAEYKLIFTKLDETTTYGNVLNIKLYSGADVAYITAGQSVPDDIEILNSQKIVKRLLGGR
ncbi:MAG: flagellar biosynthesis protein FlhF [Lachnospiraceae bacterium]|nr:flagellar biosynthesis protein FlhF [Lachnospiraceae bacterium]